MPTPDEIADRAKDVDQIKSEVQDGTFWDENRARALVAGLRMVEDAFRAGRTEPKPSPEQPTKAERIRECINKLNMAAHSHMTYHDSRSFAGFQGRLRDLTALLKQDDCHV